MAFVQKYLAGIQQLFSRLPLERVVEWCIVLSAGLLPFFVIPVPGLFVAQAKIFILALLVLIALTAWFAGRLAQGLAALPRNVLLLCASFLPVAYTASALASGGSAASFVSGSAEQDTVVIVCILYVLLVLVGITTASIGSITRLLRALFAGSAVLVVFQLVRLAAPGFSLGILQGSASSIVGSWHDLAIMCGLLVFAAIAFSGSMLTEGRVWKWLVGAVGVGAYLLLFVTNAVDVWYTLAATMLFFAAYRWYGAYARERLPFRTSLRRTSFWIACAVVIAISLSASSFVYARLPSALQIAQTEVRPSWQGTFAIGEKVLSGRSGFIFGSGPNTFDREWGRFKPEGVNTTLFWNVDFSQGVGIVPTAFVTLGALGILAWALLALVVLWCLVRLLRDRRPQTLPLKTYLAGAVFGSLYLMAFLIMYVPGITIVALAFLFFGLCIAIEVVEGHTPRLTLVLGWASWKSAIRTLVFIAACVLLVLACITTLRATLSDMYLGRAATHVASGDIAGAGALVGQSLFIFPYNDNAQRAAVQLGLARLGELVATGKTDDAARQELQATLSETIQHGLTAVSINGRDYQNWLTLAVLYQNLAGVGVQGAFDNAKAAYERAISENPTNPLLLAQLAQLEIGQGNTTVALEDLNKALALKADFPAAYYFRSQIEASRGDFAAAIPDANAATELASADPTGWYNLGAIYYAAGSYRDAAEALEHAVGLQENFANAMYILGLTYDALGRKADSLALMEKIAVLNPGNTTLETVIQNLKSGKSALSGVQ